MTDTPHKRHVIMIVDDESVVTQSVAAFLELETEHHVIQFQSPLSAIEHLKQASVDLVLSDFLMPEMNGIQFLTEAKRLHPDVPRIILTGYADKENSIRAINEVGIYQYIEKPWDNEQLRLVIANALNQKTLREQLNDRIHALDRVLRERDKLVARDEHMRAELALAERLHRSLLPSALLATDLVRMTACYVPALEIGGDFYDILPLSATRYAILLADATGHGIQAALSTAVLKFAFQSFMNCDCSPHDILRGMNRVLWQGLPEDTYVAALVAILDMDAARIEIANAGLPTPMLLHRGAGQVERVPTTGLMLGAIEDAAYDPGPGLILTLSPGDTLLLYTDGISEVENHAGDQFGDRDLALHVAQHSGKHGHEISKALLDASREYAAENHDWDDITMLAIEVK